ISLKVSAILPRRPSSSPVILTEKSPARIARRACRRFWSSTGAEGSDPSSLGLPARFFAGTPLATFLLVTVVGCIDASRITRLHPPRIHAAEATGGDKVRTAWPAPEHLDAPPPCCSPFIGTKPWPSRSPQDNGHLERPPAIKSANPAKAPFRRCDIRQGADRPRA